MNKLSEDEIIKGITNIIYTCNEITEDTDWYDEEEIKSAKEQSKLTQSLLDLYQKEKEKNKILEEELQKYISGEYFTEKQAKYLEMTRKMFWINKDKIRAKIKELEEKPWLFNNDATLLKILKELLEEN